MSATSPAGARLDERPSAPEPDLAVVSGAEDAFDAALDARNRASTCWIVDVAGRRVGAHEGPDGAGALAHSQIVAEDWKVVLPGVDRRLAVRDLLP